MEHELQIVNESPAGEYPYSFDYAWLLGNALALGKNNPIISREVMVNRLGVDELGRGFQNFAIGLTGLNKITFGNWRGWYAPEQTQAS